MKKFMGAIWFLILVSLMVFAISFYLYHHQKLLEEGPSDIEVIYIHNNRTGEDISIDFTNEEITFLIYLLDDIDEKTYLAPSEMQRQESDPLYNMEINYKSGYVGKIYSTETGSFYYRWIDDSNDGGWVGGKSERLGTTLGDYFE